MPRVGANPMKQLGQAYLASEVTVCTLTYIPETTGYWAGALDVLRASLTSIRVNTTAPFDLVVLDNGSCAEVRRYLEQLVNEGAIDLLILCSTNHGKPGAWNVLFPACPGRYIAYADSDVLYGPGWLEQTMQVFAAFDNVGMVTGRPMRTEPELRNRLLSATLNYAESTADATVERGNLIPKKHLDEHERSLGRHGSSIFSDPNIEDIRITRGDVAVYASASHFQFVVPRDVAMKLLPIGSGRALGGETDQWDPRINELGLLRVSLVEPHVWHLGNSLDEDDLALLQRMGVATQDAASRVTHHASRPGLVARALRACARQGHMRRAIEKAYLLLFEALR